MRCGSLVKTATCVSKYVPRSTHPRTRRATCSHSSLDYLVSKPGQFQSATHRPLRSHHRNGPGNMPVSGRVQQPDLCHLHPSGIGNLEYPRRFWRTLSTRTKYRYWHSPALCSSLCNASGYLRRPILYAAAWFSQLSCFWSPEISCLRGGRTGALNGSPYTKWCRWKRALCIPRCAHAPRNRSRGKIR